MEISYHSDFWSSVHALSSEDMRRVNGAQLKYQKSPEHPSLQCKLLQGKAGKRRLSTIRASDDLRILLTRQGHVTVFWRAGHHDDILRLANRTTAVVPLGEAPRLIPITSDGGDIASPSEKSVRRRELQPESRSCLEHYTDSELQDIGFRRDAIAKLRRATLDNLLDVWRDITEEELELVLKCTEHTPKEIAQGILFTDEDAVNKKFRDAIVEHGAVAGLSSLLTPGEFERLKVARIEDWMIFLHPDQRALVKRRFRGPARVRGSAGTGKTVVALHRAASLAGRYRVSSSMRQPPILFTTYIRTLPPVLSKLYEQLPHRVPGSVDFMHVDKLAHDLCTRLGQPPRLDPSSVRGAFEQACRSTIRIGTPLHGFTRSYLEEEVTHVLKGRGVDSLDEYLSLERTSRRTRFTEAMRRQAWALRTKWNELLDERGIEDYIDVVRRARDLARQQKPKYRAAIIDESQDLSLVALQLVCALSGTEDSNDQDDVLFMVGDGAQKIYPGGFTLRQAGIDVRGNSTVLKVNYRNTDEIIETAMACVGSDTVDDLGDEYRRGDAEAATLRTGSKPRLVGAGGIDQQVGYVAEEVRELCKRDELRWSDIGILATTNRLVKDAIHSLQENMDVPCQNLEDMGRRRDAVKVGTFHRAKGLEFKVLFLLDISRGFFPWPRKRGQEAAEYEESVALAKNQLFVAMTRARDALVLLHRGQPSEVLQGALGHFENVAVSAR